jgi:hypothetical protein
MIRRNVLAVLALVPAAALAQGGPIGAAKGAREASAQGDARTERLADKQLAEPAEAGTPAASAPASVAPRAGDALGVAPLEGGAAAADQGRGAVPPPDTYTVRPGDTLWDLSGRFLNNPWYWPKIWSYNPDITNPHWIFPGNILKFYPSADEAPGRVEPLAPATPGAEPQQVAGASQAEEEDLAPVRELEDFSRADMKQAATAEEQEAVAVAGPYKVGYVPTRQRFARHDTFVTPRELDESGAIEAAFAERSMLATLDRAYARFKNGAEVKVGESYLVFKTERPIVHPVTKELFGYQSTILGAAKVVAVDDKAATLVITTANEPIERGALLGPWTEKSFRPVPAKPNQQDVDGLIIGAPVSILTQLAEHQVVYVDRGTADGVEAGNEFKVVRSGDLSKGRPSEVPSDPSLPKEDVGTLLVIDAREHASAALVTRSRYELLIGDRVEMRSAAGAGGN